MLEKLKALSSKVFAEGAGPRGLKQFFVTAERKPELTLEVQAVLDYLSQNAGVSVTNRRIVRGSGVAPHKIEGIIRELVNAGLVERHFVTKQSSSYQIIGGVTDSSKVSQTTEPDGGEQDEVDFVKTTEELIYRFVRATRSTDLLTYLTWLERGGK